ncbi:hypothetical protein Tco_0741255, partial [Tanacetum coccineum]
MAWDECPAGRLNTPPDGREYHRSPGRTTDRLCQAARGKSRKDTLPNPLIAEYEKRNKRNTITYSLQPVSNVNLKWRDLPFVERHAYCKKLSKLQERSFGVLEFFSTLYFDKDVDRNNLMKEKCIWFRLCGHEHILTLPEFVVVLGLFTEDEVKHRLFEVYFGRLEVDGKQFDHKDYWTKVGKPTLTNHKEVLVKEPLMRIVHKVIMGSLVHRVASRERFQKRDLWMMSALEESRGVNLAWIIADHLNKHAPGTKENSVICAGHYVTKIACFLGYYMDDEIKKCSEPIDCEYLLEIKKCSTCKHYYKWRERFMNYLEKQTDGEAMINSIQNGDHPLPVIAQVSLAGTAPNAPLTLKDPKSLAAEKTKVSKHKEKVVVKSESEGSDDEDISDLKKITALLTKAFNRKKYYAKPTNNNFRTSSASSSANKKPEYVKLEEKKEDKKSDEKKQDMSKVKMLLAKKYGDEQVLLAEDQAWMGSSSDSDQEINSNMVFMGKMKKVLSYSEESSSSAEFESEYETSEYYDNSTNYGLFSEVDHNDSVEKDHLVDKLIKKFNQKIAKCQKRIEKANQQSKDLENQNKNLQDKYDVLQNQVNTFKEKNNEFNEQIKVLNEKNDDLLAQTKVLQEQLKVKHVVIDTHTECQAQYAKLEEERYQYMIRYSALCDNDKQHRKKIDEQEILFDKMSRQLVEMNNNVLRLQENILEKQTKISELEECVCNKDLENGKCLERLNDYEDKLHKIGQTRQTIHMIMLSKDKMYNGRKGIGFENPSYFSKAKELRHSLYEMRVIGLG